MHRPFTIAALVGTALLFLPGSARSGAARDREIAVLELESVSIDDAPATDLAAYDGFSVEIQGLGDRHMVERILDDTNTTGDWIYYESAQ